MELTHGNWLHEPKVHNVLVVQRRLMRHSPHSIRRSSDYRIALRKYREPPERSHEQRLTRLIADLGVLTVVRHDHRWAEERFQHPVCPGDDEFDGLEDVALVDVVRGPVEEARGLLAIDVVSRRQTPAASSPVTSASTSLSAGIGRNLA